MKAAILQELNKPLVLADIEIPELQCGQVLVEVHYSSICGAQLREISGDKGEDKHLPHLLGHEGSGIVKDIGVGVTHIQKGDHVVMHWRKGQGINAELPKYKWGDKTVGAGNISTFSEYAIISENRLTAIKKYIPLDVAALMGCSVTTGLGIVNNEVILEIGQSIAVIGCGGVGLNVIQAAKMVSASYIYAIDKNSDKRYMSKEFGSTDFINTNTDNIDDLKNKFDVVVECTGNEQMINSGLDLIGPGGVLVLVGQPKVGQDVTIKNFAKHYCGKTIMDSQGGLTNPPQDIPRYLNLYMDGKLKLDELISDIYPFSHVNQAIEKARSGKAVKCMLTIKKDGK